MDKKELSSPKRPFAVIFLFSLLLAMVSGCNTAKGAAEGAGKDWKSMQEADRELQKVLW